MTLTRLNAPMKPPKASAGAVSIPGTPVSRVTISTLGVLLGLALACLSPALAWADLSVKMVTDQTQVALDGRLVLQVDVSTDSLRGPEVTLPDLTGFEVLRQSVQRPMQFSFGLGGQQVKSSTKYTFVLRPLREGRIEIDPATAEQNGKKVKSQALVIQVGASPQQNGTPQQNGNTRPGTAQQRAQETQQAQAAQAQPRAAASPSADGKVIDHGDYVDAQAIDAEAFIRTIVDNGNPYEGQQVTVTMYLYSRDRLGTAPTIDQEPGTTGFWTHDLLEGQTLEQLRPQRVGNQRYHVYLLRRFAAFALRAGEHTIGPMALTIARPANLFSMFGRGGGPKPPIKRTGITLPLLVRALPAQGKPTGPTVVGRYAIDATLDRAQTATGDAVTLTATLTGQGHLQGAKLELPNIPGIEALEPQVRDLVETTEDQLGGSRVYEWLLVPKQPGTYALPRLALNTFDPTSGHYKQVRGPELSLVAAGQAIAATTPANTAPTQGVAPDSGGRSGVADPFEEELVLGPVRTQSQLTRKQNALREAPWFSPALVIPIFVLLAIAVWDALQKRRLAAPKDPRQQALAASNGHMSAANQAANAGETQRFFAEVHSGILTALESSLGKPVGSYTRGALDTLFSDLGLDADNRRELLAILDRCDSARFAPGGEDTAGLKQVLETAKAKRAALLGSRKPTGGATA